MFCKYCNNLDKENSFCNKYDLKLNNEDLTNPYTMRDEECFYKCEECKNEVDDLENIESKTNDNVCTNICTNHKEDQKLYSENIELDNNRNNKNGGNSMFNMNGLFGEFGKIENGSVALTFSGQIAIRRSENEYVRYNKETQTMENQMDMVLKEASDLIFILPVDKVEVDDIIKHKETYYQILEIDENGELIAVNIKDGSKNTIIKETNVMGFNFYYKVVSLFSKGSETNTNGIDPMMLMMMSSNKGNGNGVNNLLMAQMMSGQGDAQSMNPMMLMAMSGNIDMKTLMLMNMVNGGN